VNPQYCEEKELVMMKNGHEANISRRRKGAMKDFELLKY